jgi:hypothetical protein
MAESDSQKVDAFPTLGGAVQTFTVYAGIPAITVFPVGLIGLWMQQWMIRGYDLVDGWYVVSLVPRTVVIGFVIEIVIASVFFTVLLASTGTAIAFLSFNVWVSLRETFAPIKESSKRRDRNRPAKSRVPQKFSQRRWARAVSYVLLFIVVLLIETYYTVGIMSNRTLADTIIFTTSLLGGLVGGGVLALDYRKQARLKREDPKLKIGSSRWLFRGLAVAYVGSVISAVLAAGAWVDVFDDLPEVHLNTKDDKTMCTREYPCTLLSHYDGYWHIVKEGKVISIPDDQVEGLTRVVPTHPRR